MTNAPILSNKELGETFIKAQNDENFGFLQVGIDFDTNSFQLLKTVSKKKNEEETWKEMQSLVEDKNHTYFIARDPIDNKLFVLVHFAPDLAPVKQRMLYASSRSTLKSSLGQANFHQDYHISQKNECSAKTLKEQRTLHQKIDFRSDSEIEKEITNQESAPKAVRGQVMKSLPIVMTESGKNAINSYKEEKSKCVFLSLSGDDQSINGEEQKAQSPDEIKKLLPDDEPRYVLFNYAKSTEKDSDPEQVFAYYCPDKADRKLKFTYSTCKANVMEYCQQEEIEFFAKVELSNASELNSEYLDYHVFPEKQEKELFGVPKAPGKKGTKNRKKLDV